MGEISVNVDEAVEARIKALKKDNATLKSQVRARDKMIEELQERLRAYEGLVPFLEKVYDKLKYDLNLDDGNDSCG